MYFRRRLSLSTAIVLPMFIAFSSDALAQCVSSAGTVSVPANGATVTCYAGQTSTTQIGDGTTSATVNLQDNHILNPPAASAEGIYLQNATVTLGNGAEISSSKIGIAEHGASAITLDVGAEINAGTVGIQNSPGNSQKVTLTLGSSAKITAGTFGVRAKYTDISMQSGAQISGTNGGVLFSYAPPKTITLAAGAEISSTGGDAISAPNGTLKLTNAGLVSAFQRGGFGR